MTEEQKHRFVRDGFVHVANAVPPRLVKRARRAINHSIGSGMDRDDLTRFSNQSFCTELVSDPRLLRLATTPTVWSRVRALLGDGRTVRPQRCQIALRFPLPEAPHSRVRYLAFARHRRVPLAARRLRPKATPTSHGTTAWFARRWATFEPASRAAVAVQWSPVNGTKRTGNSVVYSPLRLS